VVDLRADVSVAVVALTQTVNTTNGVIDNVGREVEALTATSAQTMADVHETVADARSLVNNVKQGQGTIGQLLTDRTLYDRMTGISRETEGTVRNLREATDGIRAALAGFSSPDGAAQQITQTLRNTLVEVQEVTSDLAEGTEALKRNFLFRGFFRQRGFFDLDSVSREEYQSGVLEGKDRTAIRIWLDAGVLFTRDPDGSERLTDAGRRRIDAAMADLVRFPRESPLVVEGYAEVREGDAPYLLSVDRALLVRDYLLSRFRRQTAITDIMPMGEDAASSPRDDKRWSGVALAMFVRNDAITRSSSQRNGRQATP